MTAVGGTRLFTKSKGRPRDLRTSISMPARLYPTSTVLGIVYAVYMGSPGQYRI